MSVYVRRFANGFLLNDEGARVEEGRLYLDELDLIEAVAKKLGIDLDAHCFSKLSKPEGTPASMPTEPIIFDEASDINPEGWEKIAQAQTRAYAKSAGIFNAAPETD